MKRRAPRRKGKTETVVNSKYIDPLVPLVGKFMVNFGTVELLSHLWIDHFAQDEVLVEVALQSTLAKRIDIIRQLVSREEAIPLENKDKAYAAWNAAGEFAEVRNAVAHNPAVFGWHGDEQGAPDYVGIPVFRKLARSTDGKIPYIGTSGLAKAVDAVVELARDLEQQLEQIKAFLHPESCDTPT